MPYRVKGKCVQVKKGGKWRNKKCHATRRQAIKHKIALQHNVKH